MRVEEVCTVFADGDWIESKDQSDSGIRLIQTGNIGEGEYYEKADRAKYITSETFDALKCTEVFPGDILVSRLPDPLGRACIIPPKSEKMITAVDCTICRVNEKLVLKEYLCYFMQSKVYYNRLMKSVTGTTRKRISRKNLGNVEISFPQKSKQLQVVEVLDLLSTIIKQRREQINQLDTLIKARFVEMFRGIDTYCEVGHYIDSLTAGKSLAGEEECDNKVLKTGAASFDYFDASQVKNLPLDYDPQPEHRVQNGDVIISRMNTAELTGAAAYVWNVPENTYLPDRLWKAHMKEGVNPIFVWQALIQPETKEQIRRDASGTSGSMKNISKPGLLAINVKKVPAKEQDIFAAFVKQVDKSKVAIQKALDETHVLFDSLMQEYFG